MSHNKNKFLTIKNIFLLDIFSVLRDIVFAYKNFLHWNVSKVLISLWSFMLGVILSLPVFIIIIILWIFDSIIWSEIIAYALSGSNVASYELIGHVATHPFNLIWMVFLLIIAIWLFLLWSWYSLFLKAELSLGYVKEKKLKYKKNYYFHRWYILKFLGIISWSSLYLLIPIIVWLGTVFLLYLLYDIWFLNFDGLSIAIAIVSIIIIVYELYLLYRLLFWYIILADDTKKKHLKTARFYVKESMKITKWKVFFKFMFLYILFVIFILPSSLLDNYLEQTWGIMRDAMIYNSWLLQDLEPEQIQYYEYISEEYNDMTSEEINSKLNSLGILRFLLYIITYLVISWVFVLGTTSFYKRILVKK